MKGGREWKGGTLRAFPPRMQDTFTATVVILRVECFASVRNVLMVNSVMVIYFCFSNLSFYKEDWFKGRYLNEP